MDRYMQTHLNTVGTLPNLTSTQSATSIVLLHAKDDPVIPVTHSRKLFSTLLSASPKTRLESRNVRDYAEVKRFSPSEAGGKVTLIETEFGGHNQLTEGALDLVRLALGLPSHLAT